jgi:hypothetical protein
MNEGRKNSKEDFEREGKSQMPKTETMVKIGTVG